MSRSVLDFYETPRYYLDFLFDNVHIAGTILEPCSGDNAISDYFRRRNLLVTSNDIDQNKMATFHFDAMKPELYETGTYDWVITNPPFSAASTIVPLAFDKCKMGIIFLLRLSYLEPTRDRGKWLKDHRSNLSDLLVCKRHSFKGSNKDTVTVAWMVWRKDTKGTTATNFMIW